MARFPYCPTICFIPDFDCEVECSVDWSDGEPHVVVDGVYVEGHSLLTHDDKLMSDLGHRICDLAESDEALHERVFSESGIGWTGRGANDPAGRFVAAS